MLRILLEPSGAFYPNQNGKVAKVTVRIRRLQEGSGVVIDEDGPVVSD